MEINPDYLQLFLLAEWLQLIASTINWRLSWQRLWALLRTRVSGFCIKNDVLLNFWVKMPYFNVLQQQNLCSLFTTKMQPPIIEIPQTLKNINPHNGVLFCGHYHCHQMQDLNGYLSSPSPLWRLTPVCWEGDEKSPQISIN